MAQHGITWHIPEHFNTLFSRMEQLFNISLHVNSSCLGLWSDICNRACENQPCERKLHEVTFLLIFSALNVASHFCQFHKKAH